MHSDPLFLLFLLFTCNIEVCIFCFKINSTVEKNVDGTAIRSKKGEKRLCFYFRIYYSAAADDDFNPLTETNRLMLENPELTEEERDAIKVYQDITSREKFKYDISRGLRTPLVAIFGVSTEADDDDECDKNRTSTDYRCLNFLFDPCV